MSQGFEPVVIPIVEVERVSTDFERCELGQWYWSDKGSADELLMCVMEIGTNYVELHEPQLRGYRLSRVHRDQFEETLTFEPNAGSIIQQQVERYQLAIAENMAEIQRLTESLGIAPQLAHRPTGDVEGRSLALLSSQVDVGAFKTALILAKQETLPALFKKNTELSDELARWMGAPGMPLKAMLGPMKGSVDEIEDRLFNIQLYAGIFETIHTLSDGPPAPKEERLRIMQRRLYMDEEALLSYEAGGMSFEDMAAFDKWISDPVNRDRILPFARCVVSMRVRRTTKDLSGSGLSAFIQLSREIEDKYTYLFVRNGDQLYRICTDLDFGELMFPERAVFDPSEPMMIKVWGRDRVEQMMTKREYDSRVEASKQLNIARAQWNLDNPKQAWELANPKKDWYYANPHRGDKFETYNWHPFDDSSVYYDLAMRKIQSEIKEYNRIALVVQGLFDRTHTLIPHLPVQMWRASSFKASVELVYDGSMALHWGEAPDIQAYIRSCNASADGDSVFFGQEHEWMVREAERANTKSENDWRTPYDRKTNYKVLRPIGDPGPGRVAYAGTWAPRSRQATFAWLKESSPYNDKQVRATIKVSLEKLFNISAYKVGDFKRFFTDPRTRAEYLSWAPMLLSAEDYHQGKLKPSQPVPMQEKPSKSKFRF